MIRELQRGSGQSLGPDPPKPCRSWDASYHSLEAILPASTLLALSLRPEMQGRDHRRHPPATSLPSTALKTEHDQANTILERVWPNAPGNTATEEKIAAFAR